MPGTTLSSEDDRDLIVRYHKAGDPRVLGQLFSRYQAMVFGVCLKYLKNRDDAKDAVMQIFEKLTKSLMEHQVEHFKSWLYTTSRNHCLMQLRAQKGKFPVEIGTQVMETEIVMHLEEEPELELNLGKLEECIDALVSEQKRCVRLFYLEEKCYRDITGITGYELNAVKSHIQNGKRNLKICMERNG